jgi:hypothetical protein
MSESAAVRSSTCLLANSPILAVGWMWKRAMSREETLLPTPKKDSRDFCISSSQTIQYSTRGLYSIHLESMRLERALLALTRFRSAKLTPKMNTYVHQLLEESNKGAQMHLCQRLTIVSTWRFATPAQIAVSFVGLYLESRKSSRNKVVPSPARRRGLHLSLFAMYGHSPISAGSPTSLAYRFSAPWVVQAGLTLHGFIAICYSLTSGQ